MWVNKRKEAIKKFEQNPNIHQYISAKRIIAQTRRELRCKKRNKFIAFCETLNRESNVSYVWTKV